jgi:hypothetical protein
MNKKIKKPPICHACWVEMTPIIEKDGKPSEYSFKCDTPECIIHKKELILSIG